MNKDMRTTWLKDYTVHSFLIGYLETKGLVSFSFRATRYFED